ncbi:MAG: type II toxin-antitoxin system HicB family antitoxin, partial [Chloroflexi bacterium]|nr:type II toxin-antitoxin system HicB family antitoxin [Chloroflexota bacterium]
GDTLEEVSLNMREAIEFHLQGLIEDNLPIPEPNTKAEYVAVEA